MKDCKYWYAPKQECIRMTQILQENGVVNYHASMSAHDQSTQDVVNRNPRICFGIKKACLFLECPDVEGE